MATADPFETLRTPPALQPKHSHHSSRHDQKESREQESFVAYLIFSLACNGTAQDEAYHEMPSERHFRQLLLLAAPCATQGLCPTKNTAPKMDRIDPCRMHFCAGTNILKLLTSIHDPSTRARGFCSRFPPIVNLHCRPSDNRSGGAWTCTLVTPGRYSDDMHAACVISCAFAYTILAYLPAYVARAARCGLCLLYGGYIATPESILLVRPDLVTTSSAIREIVWVQMLLDFSYDGPSNQDS